MTQYQLNRDIPKALMQDRRSTLVELCERLNNSGIEATVEPGQTYLGMFGTVPQVSGQTGGVTFSAFFEERLLQRKNVPFTAYVQYENDNDNDPRSAEDALSVLRILASYLPSQTTSKG